jgi:hypothetical protein
MASARTLRYPVRCRRRLSSASLEGGRLRYYFHLRIGETVSPDEIGLEFANLETAYLEAFRAAREMWTELLAERSNPLIRAFEIADEDGQILLTLPFREVLDVCKPTLPLSKGA